MATKFATPLAKALHEWVPAHEANNIRDNMRSRWFTSSHCMIRGIRVNLMHKDTGEFACFSATTGRRIKEEAEHGKEKDKEVQESAPLGAGAIPRREQAEISDNDNP